MESLYSFDVIVQERLNAIKHYWLLKTRVVVEPDISFH